MRTNVATVLGHLVTKTYRGVDAVRRQQREELAIGAAVRPKLGALTSWQGRAPRQGAGPR